MIVEASDDMPDGRPACFVDRKAAERYARGIVVGVTPGEWLCTVNELEDGYILKCPHGTRTARIIEEPGPPCQDAWIERY